MHDARRDRLILHGGDPQRDELWTFDLDAARWMRLEPELETPDNRPPVCRREAVYIPGEDVLLTCGSPAGDEDDVGVYTYRIEENTWRRVEIPAPPGREMWEVAGQNRAMAYDPERDLVLMVLGEDLGDRGAAVVYALRYRGFSNGPRTA